MAKQVYSERDEVDMWKQQQTDLSHFLQNVTVKSYNEVNTLATAVIIRR